MVGINLCRGTSRIGPGSSVLIFINEIVGNVKCGMTLNADHTSHNLVLCCR